MLVVVSGFAVGILGGLFGVGGAEMFIPLMVYVFGFSQHRAQGTSLALLLPPLGLLAAMQYYRPATWICRSRPAGARLLLRCPARRDGSHHASSRSAQKSVRRSTTPDLPAHDFRETQLTHQLQRHALVEFVKKLCRRVQVGIRRRQLGVPEPTRDGVQRPSGFELPRAGFVPKVMEVQIDLGQPRTVRRRELAPFPLHLHTVGPEIGIWRDRFVFVLPHQAPCRSNHLEPSMSWKGNC